MDVPGYKVQRRLGGSESSEVYLALQHTFGRPVAIKVLSGDAAHNEELKDDFLSRARVARELDHPNIVRVHDAGESGEVVYRVMEYVRGGDLNYNLKSGLHVQNVLAIIKEVAAALDYAHGRGVVHGDVKPENILIVEQGTALLSDFGVAAGNGYARARGTPGYMSPEQVAGHDIDGRSDFFSLGAVFYFMLTGRLPFDSPRLGGVQPSRGPPALPLQFSAFEDTMQTLLARSPELRFRSASEIAGALDALRASERVPNAVVKSDVVSATEITAMAVLDERPGRRGIDVRRSSRSRLVGTAVTVLGVLALGVTAFFFALGNGAIDRALAFVGIIEHPDVVVAWNAAVELRRDPNHGLGVVVDAYREVLALEPGHVEAEAAISELAAEWKVAITGLIDRGEYDAASDKLTDLAATFPNDSDLTELSDHLSDRRQAEGQLDESLRLLESSGLADERAVDWSIMRLKEVLTHDPENADAIAALNRVAVFHGGRAKRFALAGDVPNALEAIKRADRANPNFEGVDAVRTAIADAVAAQARAEDMLSQAASLRETGALETGALIEAIEMYRSVLVIKPDDAVALQGLAGTSDEVLAEFQSMLNGDQLNEATRFFDLATNAGIGDVVVAEMRSLHDGMLKRIADVAKLIDEAESFLQQDYVTGPDLENNAVARLREALRLDPDNADGIRLRSMAATRLARVAEEAYGVGMLEEGLEYLDLALAVTPGIDRWRTRREQWQSEIQRIRAIESRAQGDAEDS